MRGYYELILSGRQLGWLLASIAFLLFVAFAAGVAVGRLEPPAGSVAPLAREGVTQATATPTPTTAPAALVSPTPEPTATPTATPEQLSPLAPTPLPIRPVPPQGSPKLSKEVWVQVAALGSRSEAEGVRHRVVALGFRPEQVKVLPVAAGKYRVRVGPFPDKESGGRVLARLRQAGFPQAFMVSP